MGEVGRVDNLTAWGTVKLSGGAGLQPWDAEMKRALVL